MRRELIEASRGSLWALAVCVLACSGTGVGAQAPELDRILSTTLDAIDVASIRGGKATVRWQRDGPELSGEVLLVGDLESPIIERTHHPEIAAGCTRVSRFGHSRSNRLGGRFSATADDPSRAVAELVAGERGARHLRFAYQQANEGRARLRIGLYDPEPRGGTIHYLDGRAFDAIRFWIRSPDGNAALDIRIADAQGDTAIHVGNLRELAASAVHAEWSVVSIVLQEMPELVDRSRLAALDLRTSRPGDGTVEIDNLSLCRGSAEPDRPSTGAANAAAPGKSLWVWHTSELMADRTELAEFAATIKERNIDRVYLQLPGALTRALVGAGKNSGVALTAADSGVGLAAAGSGVGLAAAGEEPLAALRFVVGALTGAGAAVDALDGDAGLALPENHVAVERAVQSVLRYNDSSPPESRFAGVHYDIEPYLLPGFSGEDRPRIIDGYLTVLERITALTTPAGLRFEVAIPFWFDSVLIHRPSQTVEGSLSYRLLSEAVIDLVDSVAIMDYRTRADGSNGTVALAASELEYASETGKHVRIGLETGFLANREELKFEREGEPGLPQRESSRPWIVVADTSAGARMYLVPSSRLLEMPARLSSDGVESTSVRHWRAVQRVRIDARRLTFHDVGIERLRSVIDESTAEMRGYTAFEGFAIHYDRPYRRLLDQRAEVSDDAAGHGQDQH